MANQRIYEGGCLCGGIRFEATGPASNPHTCSCKLCQRHSGAITTSWVEFPKGSISWTGENGSPALYRSSDYSSRAFCRTCGSTIGAIDDEPVVALLLGVFDNPENAELAPVSHSFSGCRPDWWNVGISEKS